MNELSKKKEKEEAKLEQKIPGINSRMPLIY
jgi:hypothetical protein